MSTIDTIAILRQFNEWLRGDRYDMAPPTTREMGAAIDAAIEMIERLEAAEADALEQARLNGMGSEREAALMAKLEAAEKERDAAELMSLALQAKIEQMERQEPVAWMLNCQTLGGDTGWILSWTQSGAGLCNRLQGEENEKRLYALPCAQPAPSVPDGWKLVPIEPTQNMLDCMDLGSNMLYRYRALLAAAPEAKP